MDLTIDIDIDSDGRLYMLEPALEGYSGVYPLDIR